MIKLSQSELILGNTNIYLYFLSFLNIEMTQVVEILPRWC